MAASRTVALVNLKLAAIKQAIEDLARARAIHDYAVLHKHNARDELVIAVIVRDKDGPLAGARAFRRPQPASHGIVPTFLSGPVDFRFAHRRRAPDAQRARVAHVPGASRRVSCTRIADKRRSARSTSVAACRNMR